MALFKKTKKKSPEQKYYEDLMEQIGFAAAKNKYAIYVPAKDEEEAQEFKDFIQNIKPSDFEKLMKGKHEESDQ